MDGEGAVPKLPKKWRSRELSAPLIAYLRSLAAFCTVVKVRSVLPVSWSP